MLSYQEIEIFVLVLVTLIYAMFDVFNKRNVPNIFVYATIGLGVALALVANSGLLLAIDLSIAGCWTAGLPILQVRTPWRRGCP